MVGRVSQAGVAEDDIAESVRAAPAAHELLDSTGVGDHQPPKTQHPLDTQSIPSFELDEDASPSPSSQHSSVIALSSPPASEDGFDFVDEREDISQTDGTSVIANTFEHGSAAVPSQPQSTYSIRTISRTLHRFANISAGLLGSSNTMDGGGPSSGHDYGDTDWQQAGQNADEQDLAGPGAHGFLNCTVDSPQKEGEGTQNPYISFLVTSNVRQTSHLSIVIAPTNTII